MSSPAFPLSRFLFRCSWLVSISTFLWRAPLSSCERARKGPRTGILEAEGCLGSAYGSWRSPGTNHAIQAACISYKYHGQQQSIELQVATRSAVALLALIPKLLLPITMRAAFPGASCNIGTGLVRHCHRSPWPQTLVHMSQPQDQSGFFHGPRKAKRRRRQQPQIGQAAAPYLAQAGEPFFFFALPCLCVKALNADPHWSPRQRQKRQKQQRQSFSFFAG